MKAQGRTRKLGGRLRRSANVETRTVGDQVFLAAGRAGTIHHLDRMASAAWRALAKPRTADEIVELFHAAFPATPKRKIAKDVTDILAFLADSKLIVGSGSGQRKS